MPHTAIDLHKSLGVIASANKQKLITRIRNEELSDLSDHQEMWTDHIVSSTLLCWLITSSASTSMVWLSWSFPDIVKLERVQWSLWSHFKAPNLSSR